MYYLEAVIPIIIFSFLALGIGYKIGVKDGKLEQREQDEKQRYSSQDN